MCDLFEPRDEGNFAIPLDGSLEGFDSLAVTLEPSGGSLAPTRDVVLTADVQAAGFRVA